MSRTYRKNPRWFYKYKGDFCTTYRDRTVKGDVRDYKDVDFYIFKHTGTTPVFWSEMHGSQFRKVVTVCDSETYNKCPSGVKRVYRRMDRRRAKHALRVNGDAFVKSSYDPWDYI